MVCNGFIPEEWTTFNEIVPSLLQIVTFCPALRNDENNSLINFNNFNLPGNERCYCIEENGIHYIVLDNNSDCGIGSKQCVWLENDLQKISNDVFL